MYCARALLHLPKLISKNSQKCPFCVVELCDESAAQALIVRSILAQEIYELWAGAKDYESLHAKAKRGCVIDPKHRDASFRFAVDCFQGKRSKAQQRDIIESFSYLGFNGPIRMSNAEVEMCVFEEYEWAALQPRQLYLGRMLAKSNRGAVARYDLKKRQYISKTSMDAELSLVAANITLAAPGKLMYDPFVGTGSFSVTSAHFGAVALGSDIDGRSLRGNPNRNLRSNFAQYGMLDKVLDNFVADLTHCPLRSGQWIDGIICDPPYGVREGPKVLGYREGKEAHEVFIDGIAAHMREGYIPAKKPYAFQTMLQDILDFAFVVLVDNGRLSMWMPCADDENVHLAIPSHPGLELLATCVQPFNKWSRRLLTYERMAGYSMKTPERPDKPQPNGTSANELNPFRKKVGAVVKMV